MPDCTWLTIGNWPAGIYTISYFVNTKMSKGSSRNDVTHFGGRGICQKVALLHFSKMGDKGERGVKNLKKWMTSFMDGPLYALVDNTYFRAMWPFDTISILTTKLEETVRTMMISMAELRIMRVCKL